MDLKKFLNLDGLQRFLDNLFLTFSKIDHTHEIITETRVDEICGGAIEFAENVTF